MNTTADKKTLTTEEIIEEIKKTLVAESDNDISIEDIEPSMSLREELGMDSMQAVEMILDLEDTLDTSLDGNEIADLQTVGDLIAMVERKVKAESVA